MPEITRVNIPIDTEIFIRLERRARKLGFDSVQAYVRVWAKAEVEGRELWFEKPVLGEMARAALTVISNLFHKHLMAFWNDEGPNFNSIEEALKYVHDYYLEQLVVIETHEVANDLEFDG